MRVAAVSRAVVALAVGRSASARSGRRTSGWSVDRGALLEGAVFGELLLLTVLCCDSISGKVV